MKCSELTYTTHTHTHTYTHTQTENGELESQLKWLKRESEEAKLASEANIKEVLSIAEDLRIKKAEQTIAFEELKRLANCMMDKTISARLIALPPTFYFYHYSTNEKLESDLNE